MATPIQSGPLQTEEEMAFGTPPSQPTSEPGFEGLQEVSASSAKSEPGFEGLQPVDSGFEGLKEADRLDLDDEAALTGDDAFRPAQFIAENPNVANEPERFQKLLNVYRQKRIKGLEFDKVAKAAVKEAPGTLAKTAKGAGQLAKRVVDFGVQPAVNEVLGFLTPGINMKDLREETRRGQLKAAAEVTSGTEQAITGLTQLGTQGYRKLFGTSPEKATDSELYDQLLVDSEFHKLTNSIATGNSDLAKSVGLDADFLAKNGVEIDPNAIENLSLVDPLTLVATAGVFKVVGVGGKVVATAATKVGAQAAMNGLQKIAAKAIQATGKGVSATGEVLQKAPVRTPSAAVVGGALATGNVPGALASAAIPAATRAGGRALEAAGNVVREAGEVLTPGFTGPLTPGMARLAKIATSPAAQVAKGAAKGAAVGTAIAAPLALSADESQTAGAILGGGAILGATAGGVHSTGQVAGKSVANFVAKKYLDPKSIQFEPVNSPGYGFDKALDQSHETAMAALPDAERNAVNTFREALRDQGGEIYVQDQASYLQRIRESLQRENGGQPLTPEQEAQAQTYADTHAEFSGVTVDAAGNARPTVFLNSNAKGLPHDAGHLFQALLSADRQAQLRQAVFDHYTPEQIKEFGDAYAQKLGETDFFNKLGEEAAREKIADELIAENFSQLFGNTPLTDLKAPKTLLETLGRTAAEAGEALGLDLTGGRTTPDLQANPSFRLQGVLRNAAKDVLNLPAVREKLTLPEVLKPEPVPASDIKPVSPEPAPSPIGEIPVVGEIPVETPKAPTVDAAAKRAQETGIAEAREMTKADPEASATVDTISKSMEAGNPALKIEHRGITSEAPQGPRGETRTPRRSTQEKGYQELEALQIENRKNAPESIVSVHEKTFVPVRWTSQGGKATLIAMSLDKVMGNIRKIVEEAASKRADKLIPYESVGGELTEKGWADAMADVKTYAENQSNGYRGDGNRLVRPSDEAGVSIPAENPNYQPKPLGEAQANFANLVQGLAPPQTARSVKGTVPGNVKAQMIAEANQRTPQPVAVISAKDITKQNFAKPFESRTVKETNPLRNELASKGVNVRALTEVTERFAAQDIASVTPATGEAATFKAPVTDVIRGGFLPKDRPIAETVKTIESATPDEWQTLFGPQQSLTKSAYETGLNLKSMEEVNALKEAQDRANALGKSALERFKGGDADAMPEVQAQGLKAQFFREAYEAATDSGSAANPRVGWRRIMPEGKPPFPKGPSGPSAPVGPPEGRSFLPARSESAPETNVLDYVSKLPPTPPGKVRLFHGEGGAQGGGTGGAFYTSNPMKASSFGESVSYVDLPIDAAKRAWGRAKETGFSGGDVFLLDGEDLKASQKIQGKITPPTYDLDARFLPKSDKAIRDLAAEYAKTAKIPYRPAETYAVVNQPLAEKLADFYDSAKSNPSDPAVQKSYQALADETIAQYKAMTDAGYTIEPFKGEGEPYKSSEDAIRDIRENKHLYFLKTEGNFAGARDNPMLADSGIVVADEPLLVNDVFRAVHDFFGHGKEGYQFGPRGEFNAWRAHSEMYSPEAQGALAAETLAQNSWVNFGKHLRKDGKIPQKGEEGFVPLTERPFAEQKAIIVPDELIQEAKKNAFLPRKKAHDYEVSMDYKPARIEPRLKSELADEKVFWKSKNPDAPFEDFDVVPVKPGSLGDKVAKYVDGTSSHPVIVIDMRAHQNLAESSGRLLGELLQDTIKHELVHAVEDSKGMTPSEKRAEMGNINFLPRAKSGRKVTAADIVKRDEEGRPLTRGGLVDYEKLYAERSKQKKEQEAADLSSLEEKVASGKYDMPEGATTSQASTGWVLPDGNFVPIDAAYHQDWLAKNSAQLNKDFGTKLSDIASVEERLSALNSGFVRVRDNRGANTVIELNSRFWKGDTKKAVEDLLLRQPNNVFPDRFTVTLLDDAGNTVDSASARLFDSENPLQDATEALGQLKAVTTERPKVGPTDIQRARAMGQAFEPKYLPKQGTKEFNDYVTERIKESRKYPEALPLEFRMDEDGNYKTGFNDEPLPAVVDYDLANTPLAKKLRTKNPAESEEKFTDALSKRIQQDYKAAKKNPEIEAGETWYSVCREKLQNLLGDDTKFFAELLGATSPQTGVDVNFGFALDAYNQFKLGKFDKILEKYEEGRKAFSNGDIEQFSKETGKTGKKATEDAFLNWWVDKHNLIPTQSNGKRYGMNSRAVLRVLDGSWLKNVKGPKTPNFTGNLTGDSFEATIDVWAMRMLHRMANEGNTKRWRIQPANETGVTDADFFVGQKAFRKAADALGIQPDALQAILWFAEKDLWTKNGWTKVAGKAKSDYNSLLQQTEKTEKGTLRKVDKQGSLPNLGEDDIPSAE